jgi:hypothetical protein
VTDARRRSVFIQSGPTAPRSCPVCRRTLDAYTSLSVDPSNPRPVMTIDDLTRCAYCAAVLVVTTIGFRVATDADLVGLDDDLRRVLLTDFLR